MPRGVLRIYLGAAPGVGKTYAMLSEGCRRAERGTDVVIAVVESHGRPRTAALVKALPVVERQRIHYRGSTFEEMDLDAVIARHPKVALVDELAHSNVPGCRNEKRWHDVEELLDAGIDVITTINVQHLESLNDVVEQITGVSQRETVPDAVVRAAAQIELVDMAPEALRRRMAHGNVYQREKIDAALSNYFRVGNLTALRELALLWLADKVDEGLQHYRTEHRISGVWAARERVVVGLTGGPEGETLIRRGARIASRGGADLLAVHVRRDDGLAGASPATLAAQRALTESLGGSYREVVGADVPTALIEFARAENATQVVVGASRRSRLTALFTGAGIGATTVRLSGPIDVLMVTHEEAAGGARSSRRHRRSPVEALSPRRRAAGFALAVVLLPALTAVLTGLHRGLDGAAVSMAYLLVVVGVAVIGGFVPAIATALVSSALLDYFFIPPVGSFRVGGALGGAIIGEMVATGALVSSVVGLAARRSREAARAAAESEALATLAGSTLVSPPTLGEVLERIRDAFGLESVALFEIAAGQPPRLVTGCGGDCVRPADADELVPAGTGHQLALRGGPLQASDRRILRAYAAQVAGLLERAELARAVQAAAPLAEADRLRTALLAAVSHDLRTPLASAKAAVSSLRSSDVKWQPAERAELLSTADESLDRLTRLVENLLDMSRLQAGALAVSLQAVSLEEVLPGALDELGVDSEQVELALPAELPEVRADAALLERVVVNVVANALRYSPRDRPPVLAASVLGDRVELRVVDSGPGIPEAEWERVFVPFQRLGDADTSTGVGLGLALARGLVEAMGGSLTPEETPGGGLTMVVSLRAVNPPHRLPEREGLT